LYKVFSSASIQIDDDDDDDCDGGGDDEASICEDGDKKVEFKIISAPEVEKSLRFGELRAGWKPAGGPAEMKLERPTVLPPLRDPSIRMKERPKSFIAALPVMKAKTGVGGKRAMKRPIRRVSILDWQKDIDSDEEEDESESDEEEDEVEGVVEGEADDGFSSAKAGVAMYSCYLPSLVSRDIRRSVEQRTRRQQRGPTSDRRNSALLAHERSSTVQCAVLFADLSGFTALTERLAIQEHGAEILCSVINGYFGALLAVIDRYGGDVVKFAGDAMAIIWPVGADDDDVDGEGSEGGLQRNSVEALLTCARCSTALHACIEAYTPPVHEHDQKKGARAHSTKLQLHMGIGVGKATLLYIGGANNSWEYVIGGDPLRQIAIAEPLAENGTTVCSPQAYELLGELIEATPVEGHEEYMVQGPFTDGWEAKVGKAVGWPENVHRENAGPPSPSDPRHQREVAKQMKSFIPHAVISKLLFAGRDAYIAEMREVSVMFVRLCGLEISGSHSLPQAQSVFSAAQNAVHQFEGTVLKMLVDDKGTTLLACMGLPPIPHVDDPLRAVAAAFSIRRSLDFQGVNVAVGITTGSIFCGVVGSDVRREYTVMGDQVNLSARLMASALEDEVLVDYPTATACLDWVQFITHAPLHLKGKMGAIQVYMPVRWLTPQMSAKRNKTSPAKHIAQSRHGEARPFAAMFRAHPWTLLMIQGEEGIGKSHLVNSELTAVAKEKGYVLLGSQICKQDFLDISEGTWACGNTEWDTRCSRLQILRSFNAFEAVFVEGLYMLSRKRQGHKWQDKFWRGEDHENIGLECRSLLLEFTPVALQPFLPLLESVLPSLQVQKLRGRHHQCLPEEAIEWRNQSMAGQSVDRKISLSKIIKFDVVMSSTTVGELGDLLVAYGISTGSYGTNGTNSVSQLHQEISSSECRLQVLHHQARSAFSLQRVVRRVVVIIHDGYDKLLLQTHERLPSGQQRECWEPLSAPMIGIESWAHATVRVISNCLHLDEDEIEILHDTHHWSTSQSTRNAYLDLVTTSETHFVVVKTTALPRQHTFQTSAHGQGGHKTIFFQQCPAAMWRFLCEGPLLEGLEFEGLPSSAININGAMSAELSCAQTERANREKVQLRYEIEQWNEAAVIITAKADCVAESVGSERSKKQRFVRVDLKTDEELEHLPMQEQKQITLDILCAVLVEIANGLGKVVCTLDPLVGMDSFSINLLKMTQQTFEVRTIACIYC
jgi:class 3 adenylate cyclase